MPVVGADTHQTLSGISSGDMDVLENAIGLREQFQAGTGLDARSYAMVKIATLIALPWSKLTTWKTSSTGMR